MNDLALVIKLQKRITELSEEIETLKLEINRIIEEKDKDIEYWEKKAQDIYIEYQLLCDKIITQGIFFKKE